jgi:hypothetical protein
MRKVSNYIEKYHNYEKLILLRTIYKNITKSSKKIHARAAVSEDACSAITAQRLPDPDDSMNAPILSL